MTHHLSTLQVKQLCLSALPEEELATAALHTADCQSCHERFVQELNRHRGSAPFTFILAPEFWFRNDHLDFDQLVSLADGTLDPTTQEITDIHLEICKTCREDVRSFLAFRDATDREMGIHCGQPEYQAEVAAAPWWGRLPSRPVYAAAAIVLMAIAVLIGVIILNRRSDPLEARKQDATDPHVDRSLAPSPAPNDGSSHSSVKEPPNIVVLKDAGGEVSIAKNGSVTGMDEASESSRQYVAQAALTEQLAPAHVLRLLSGEHSGLRGNDNGAEGFRLLYPAQRVVIDDRPLFRWSGLPRASSYRVYLLDANGRQVGLSEDLLSTQTQWTPTSRLHRGQIYSWVVTAIVDGKKIVSPAASAPEVRFAILSSADFQELGRLKKSNSHLALGVFYARAGLLRQAEREFESLLKLNPQSAFARKLLQGARTMRKEN